MIFDIPQRFSEKFIFVGFCWIWTAAKDKDGYGIYKIGNVRKMVKAHRYSYSFFKGDIPKDMLVCHKCDNPSCVNPNHLFLGTAKDNYNDMKRKGRDNIAYGDRNGRRTKPELIARGENSSTAKLTQVQVDEIRKTYKRGIPKNKSDFSLNGLAIKYGVSTTTIGDIVNNKSWIEKANKEDSNEN